MTFIKNYWIAFVIVFGISMFIKPTLCVFMLGGLAFYFGVASIIFLKNIQKKGIECMGNILEYQSDNDGYKTPLIEFTTLRGELIKEQPFVYASTDLSKIRSYKSMINQPVSILYDPDNPKKFVLTNEKEFNYLVLTICILVGSIFIALSIGSFLGYIPIG